MQNSDPKNADSMSSRDKQLQKAASTAEAIRLFDPLLPLMAGPDAGDRFTASIEMLDQSPRFVAGKVERDLETYLQPKERRFRFMQQELVVRIHPAYIETKPGKFKHFYPGEREEFVELALRKLATDGKGILLDDQAGVLFNLYELQDLLKRFGHSYSYRQLHEALQILSLSRLTIESLDGARFVTQGYIDRIEGVENVDSEEEKETGRKDTRILVRFNDLITKSIKYKLFRLLDFEKTLLFRSVISRAIYKLLAHRYTQASPATPFTISLETMIESFGLETSSPSRTYIPKIEKALDELVSARILRSYKTEKVKTENKGTAPKISQVLFHLFATEEFTRQTIRTNVMLKSNSRDE